MVTFVMWTTRTRIKLVTFLIATMRIILFQFQWSINSSSIYFFSYLSIISQPLLSLYAFKGRNSSEKTHKSFFVWFRHLMGIDSVSTNVRQTEYGCQGIIEMFLIHIISNLFVSINDSTLKKSIFLTLVGDHRTFDIKIFGFFTATFFLSLNCFPH